MLLRFRAPERRTKVRFFSTKKQLAAALAKSRRPVILLDQGLPWDAPLPGPVIPCRGGEASKHWNELGNILESLAKERVERSQTFFVLGGGAACDLGALAAGLYRRGMPLVLVPSTLLGMVDASLGGKTAVDHGALKNFAGTFYPADEVWICPELLETLAPRERLSGACELWKMLWIAGGKTKDQALLAFVAGGAAGPGLLRLIKRSLAEKARIVERDPLDLKRVREVLNFGHSAGHAIEAAAKGGLSHGESVLWGMAVETQLLGMKGRKMAGELRRVIAALGLNMPPLFREVSELEWTSWLRGDKKMRSGKLEMTVLTAPGRAARLRLDPRRLSWALKAFPESFPL